MTMPAFVGHVPSPLAVERRHRARRVRELEHFLDHGRPGDTYSTTSPGRIIAIRKVILMDGRPVNRRVTLAYLGEVKTWTVER